MITYAICAGQVAHQNREGPIGLLWLDIESVAAPAANCRDCRR
jgi:hypothetical protein